jgi:hypothetical protein
VTAVVHGVLTQRLMVEPVAALTEGRVSRPVARLVPLLLQFSTFNWLVGALALVLAAFWAPPAAKLAVGWLVGSSYLFGAVGNFWGAGRRHPGWMLLSVALLLIGAGHYGG